MFEFVGRDVWYGEGDSRPRHFGVGNSAETIVFGVVGDLGPRAEGEVDWVAVDNSLDVEAAM